MKDHRGGILGLELPTWALRAAASDSGYRHRTELIDLLAVQVMWHDGETDRVVCLVSCRPHRLLSLGLKTLLAVEVLP